MTKFELRRLSLLKTAFLCFFVFSLSLSSNPVLAEQLQTATNQSNNLVTLTIPRPRSMIRKNRYIEALIKTAIESQGNNLVIKYADLPFNQTRANLLLKEGKLIDLAWLPVTKERVELLEHVAIPLYKGLHGNRILLINKFEQSRFSNISEKAQLAALEGVQARSWSDYDVLTRNGFKINGKLDMGAMYRAVSDGLADYFPRSVLTVVAEFNSNAHLDIAIEQSLLLRYPSYHYFFLSSGSVEKSERIKSAFDKIYLDGTFDQLFEQYYGAKIAGLNLNKRQLIEMENPQHPSAN